MAENPFIPLLDKIPGTIRAGDVCCWLEGMSDACGCDPCGKPVEYVEGMKVWYQFQGECDGETFRFNAEGEFQGLADTDADGEGDSPRWKFCIKSSSSAAVPAGYYRWVKYGSFEGERVTIESGTICVEENLEEAGKPGFWEEMVGLCNQALKRFMERDGSVSFTVAQDSYSFSSLAEINEMRDRALKRIELAKRKAAQAAGIDKHHVVEFHLAGIGGCGHDPTKTCCSTTTKPLPKV